MIELVVLGIFYYSFSVIVTLAFIEPFDLPKDKIKKKSLWDFFVEIFLIPIGAPLFFPIIVGQSIHIILQPNSNFVKFLKQKGAKK